MTMKDIARDFEVKRNIDLEVIKSRERLHKIAVLRQELMWTLREVKINGRPRYSYPQIAKFLRRDHTTVIHGVRAHEQRIAR
jgi:chromosomal replication initiation ATPase DnaA